MLLCCMGVAQAQVNSTAKEPVTTSETKSRMSPVWLGLGVVLLVVVVAARRRRKNT
jgi:LPXTG-motif cell wall-anchored protein